MTAQLIRSLNSLTLAERGGVVTIGNFDGVHIGHQQLINEVIAQAHRRQVPATLITFEPHPLEFLKPAAQIPRLTKLREKFVILQQYPLQNVIILKFNQALASVSASDFINQIYTALKPASIIIGDDFHFGRGREGDHAFLEKMGRQLGFEVTALPSVLWQGERVSSTRVRQALQEGDLTLATALLGHPYFMLGRVAYGDQLGRRLGFPTANIHVARKLTPVQGVFAVLVHGLSDKPLWGAANVGTRPAVNGTRTLLEVHLLDFDKTIYGKELQVEFCTKLRDEAYFPDLSLLQAQIAKDVIATRDYFLSKGTYE